jgi:uncharacterized membrane protein YuzA (DUF378 family)
MAITNQTRELSTPTWIAIALTVIGAINWGLVGLFKFDLVAALFGSMSAGSRIVYILVALAGVYLLAMAATRLSSRPTSHAPGHGSAGL